MKNRECASHGMTKADELDVIHLLPRSFCLDRHAVQNSPSERLQTERIPQMAPLQVN